jgi:hypothetical protein
MQDNSQRLLPSATTGQPVRPLHELDRVLAAITAMAARIGRPFSETRMDQLITDLAPYPVQAIEWALDSWGRSAEKLPSLSNILKLLDTWHTDHVEQKCDCDHLHGTGYGTDDIRWLLHERGKHAKRFSISDWEELFAELDKKRAGGAPKWRETPEGQQFLRI